MRWYEDPEFWNDILIVMIAFLAGALLGTLITLMAGASLLPA